MTTARLWSHVRFVFSRILSCSLFMLFLPPGLDVPVADMLGPEPASAA